jgi:hypothetical protein
MAIKKVKLTEADLNRIVKKVIEEQVSGNDRISNLAAMMKSIQTKQVPQQVIVNPSSKLNGMQWKDYVTKFKITPQEIAAAQKLNVQGGDNQPTGATGGSGKLVSKPARPSQPQAQMTPPPQRGQAIKGLSAVR